MARYITVLALVIAVGTVVPGVCAAKSYAVERIQVDASVLSDGSMKVAEEITYLFDGSFTFAFREIPLKRGERMTGITLTDGGRPYTASPGQQPGTFRVDEENGTTRVTWYYAAKNERKTFIFSYVIEGVVRRYEDTAELYYQFVGDAWDRTIRDVFVRIRMPDGVKASEIRTWAHGPLHGTVEIRPSAEVTLSVSPLPAHTFWEARVLCPPEFFAGVDVSRGGARMASILAEEAAWAAEANARRDALRQQAEIEAIRAEERTARARTLLPICVLLGLGGLGVWFVLFRRHGWPHPVRVHVAPGEIPSDHAPALVAYLMSRTVSGPAIVATLVDLASRGYLEIHQQETTVRGWFGRTKKVDDYSFEATGKLRGDLAGFERDLLEFMMSEAGDSSSFTMSRFKQAASKHRSRFQKWFRGWVKTVNEHGKALGFYEPYPVLVMVCNMFCGAAIAAFGFYVCIATESAAGIPAIIGGFVQAILTVALTRRTAEGRRLYLAWRGFKKHLAKIGTALGPATLDSSSWAAYMAAAIVFGMHKKVIPKLQMVDGSGHTVMPVWFYGTHGSTFEHSVSGLASGFSSMIDSVSTTVSSASGAGGGASGGGGGGSGGGGGGAG